MSGRGVLKKGVDEEGERMYADLGNDGDGFEREKVVEREELKVTMGAKVFVRRDEVGEKVLSAVTDKNWVTGGGRRSESES